MYNYSNGLLSIGRGNPYFYNMNESLLINPYFPSAEYVWWQHEVQWFQYDWGFLMLNEINNFNHFLTFHRYSINRNNWRIGFTEAIDSDCLRWSLKAIMTATKGPRLKVGGSLIAKRLIDILRLC